MEKVQAKTVAQDVFKRYPNEKEVYVTEDGQAFFNEIHAKNHSVTNRTGKKLEIFFFQREDEKSADNAARGTKTTAKGLIEQIEKDKTAEAVTVILKTEKAGENRTSVIQAAEKKITEISKPE